MGRRNKMYLILDPLLFRKFGVSLLLAATIPVSDIILYIYSVLDPQVPTAVCDFSGVSVQVQASSS
jgi:hypothetical protein